MKNNTLLVEIIEYWMRQKNQKNIGKFINLIMNNFNIILFKVKNIDNSEIQLRVIVMFNILKF
jgi:hypothetical protein